MRQTKLTLDPAVLNQRLQMNWLVAIIPVLGGLWVALSCLVPFVHQRTCRRDAAEKRETMVSAFRAVEAATDVRFSWTVMNDEGETFASTLTYEAWAKTTAASDTLPALIPATVAWIEYTAYEAEGYIDAMYALKSCLRADGKTIEPSKARALPAGHLPHWTVRYSAPGSVQGNLTAIRPFLETFVRANRQAFPSLNVDSLLADTFRLESVHDNAVRSLRDVRTRIRVLATAAMVMFGLAALIPQIRRVYAFCSERHQVYKQRGVSVRRPSLWRLVWSWSLARYILRYEQCCRDVQRAQHKRVLAERKEIRQGLRDQAALEALEDSLLRFLEALPTRRLTSGLEGAIAVAGDDDESYSVRREAFARARQLLQVESRPQLAVPAAPTVDELTLLAARVASVDSDASSDPRFQDCVRRAESAKRSASRTYWLQRALELEHEEASETVGPPSRSVAVAVSAPPQRDVLTIAALKERLGIRQFLPALVAPEYVEEIIFELMEPTKQGAASFMGRRRKGKYRRPQPVVRNIRHRIGKAFDQRVFDATVDWMLDAGILLRKRKSHYFNLALNSEPEGASPEGRPIVERNVAFYQWVQRELTH